MSRRRLVIAIVVAVVGIVASVVIMWRVWMPIYDVTAVSTVGCGPGTKFVIDVDGKRFYGYSEQTGLAQSYRGRFRITSSYTGEFENENPNVRIDFARFIPICSGEV